MKRNTTSAAIRALLDVSSLAVEIKAATMGRRTDSAAFRSSGTEERIPLGLWNVPQERIKTHLVMNTHYKVDLPDWKEWNDGFGFKHRKYGSRADQRPRTV